MFRLWFRRSRPAVFRVLAMSLSRRPAERQSSRGYLDLISWIRFANLATLAGLGPRPERTMQ